jgi:hypothetical protein
MGFYATYFAIFSRVKVLLEAKTNIKAVSLGEQFRLTSLPLAIINPEETVIEQETLGEALLCKINFSVILIIRETEPADWFTEILTVLADAFDAIVADRTLNGTVKDTTPTLFSPGEIKMQSKLYYGGVVRFQSSLEYTPA